MLHFPHHLLHPLKVLWAERIALFWPFWTLTTCLSAMTVTWVVPRKKTITQESTQTRRYGWSRDTYLALGFLILFLACFIAMSLVREEFTYYDDSHFTNETLAGRNVPVQILPEAGRFWPLGHQEFSLLRHFTRSVTGYHSLRIVQLLLLSAILLVLDEELSIKARVGLIALVFITPSILISLSGLIYSEANIVFCLACLVWFVKRFERTRSVAWAVAAVISSQLMLYFKETAFLLLLGFALGRLLLRCWKTDQGGWNFRRLRDPESRLDMCLALLVVPFFLYYIAAMFPNYGMRYASEFRLSVQQVFVSYLKLDLLVWVLAAVVLIRVVKILRRKVAPALLWDGLALAGVSCFAGYLLLRMHSAYFLAPVDLIAVLYLGHLMVPSLQNKGLGTRCAALALLCLVGFQDLSLSAFRMYEKKNVIHAKAEMGQMIADWYRSDPEKVKRLYFPFATPFHILEFASYLNYLGVPVEQDPTDSPTARSVLLVGKVIEKEGPCGYRKFICHPGGQPDHGDLTVVFPDDPTRADGLVPFKQEQVERIFCYHPRPAIPSWLYPYVASLHVVSPVFPRSQLPGFWLNAQVAVWH
jgi:hypothetical protein